MAQCSFGAIWRFCLLIGVLAMLAVFATAKRVTPKPVPPLISSGVRYSAEGDGRNQYVVARDISDEKVLWKVLVFHTSIDPFKEEDVQWVFINELKLTEKTLFVRDEKSRCYLIDLATRSVKKQAWCSEP
jgi:hypothetical protein